MSITKITSPFGPRIHPLTGVLKGHTGIDLGSPHGSPVYASSEVTVSKVKVDPSGYGNYIDVKDENGYTHRYAHLDSLPNVKPGDKIQPGKVIAMTGGTPGSLGAGGSTGAHLHYELHDPTGRPIDPEQNKEKIQGSFEQNSGKSLISSYATKDDHSAEHTKPEKLTKPEKPIDLVQTQEVKKDTQGIANRNSEIKQDKKDLNILVGYIRQNPLNYLGDRPIRRQ